MRPSPRPGRRGGFTLVELMVVVLIIILISAATIPAILPALNSRRVSEGSRVLQGELSRQRDLAVRANAPRGIRLLPDPIDPTRPDVLTSSRIVALETGPDYEDGVVVKYFDMPPYILPNPAIYQYYNPPAGLPQYGVPPAQVFTNARPPNLPLYPYLVVRQDKAEQPPSLPGVFLPRPPTAWFYNIRQGEKLRFNDSGGTYTVAGPITDPTIAVTPFADLGSAGVPQPNPDRFINYGAGYVSTLAPGTLAAPAFDFLFLVNGTDDDGDGFIDEGFDGIDNDGDGIIDPGFNGRDDNGNGFIDEWQELYLHATGPNGTGPFIYPGCPDGGLPNGGFPAMTPNLPNEYEEEVYVRTRQVDTLKYTISRRPVPVEGAREVALPTNVVIDLTTWNAVVPERSRLPVDPFTGFVDVMVAPNGQVVIAAANANPSPPVNFPYYHFWLTERDEIVNPTPLDVANGKTYLLPMPRGSGNDPRIASPQGSASFNNPALQAERRLLSINTRTGVIVPTAVETFYLNNPSYPFEAAESGQKDSQP